MDAEPPTKPLLEDIDAEEMVGIDVGILKYVHDTDGTAVESLTLSKLSGQGSGSSRRPRVRIRHRRLKTS